MKLYLGSTLKYFSKNNHNLKNIYIQVWQNVVNCWIWIYEFILSLFLFCVCLECFHMSFWKKKIIRNTTPHLYSNYSFNYLSFSVQKIVLIKPLKPHSRVFALTPHHSCGSRPASASPMRQWPLRSMIFLWQTKLVEPALCVGGWVRFIAFPPPFFIEFIRVALYNKIV